MENQNPVAILLGTYNADKYIEDLLDSLIIQTYQEWTLYIRDDGSLDNTKTIVEQYARLNENIVWVEDSKGNLGTKNNFQELLTQIDSDYYMFCDQDDVWLPNKIELTLNKMHQIEASTSFLKPVLIYSDLVVVDSNLKILSPSFWEYSRIKPNLLSDFNYLVTYNLVTGCTMMINHKAKLTSLPILEEAIMHDCWIALKVLDAGGVLADIKKQTILYRQHENNLIGAQNQGENYFLSKLKNINQVYIENIARYKMANKIRETSIFAYLFYKTLYLYRR